MFIQRGLAPLHMVLATIDMSADKCLPLLERLIEAGAAINQIITDGIWVCICMLHKRSHILYFAIYLLILTN